MDKNQLAEKLNKTIGKINKIIEGVNYAKVHHKSSVVITCCANAEYDLKEIQKDLTELAAQLTAEEKQLFDGLNQSAGELDSVIENLNYAKVHYKSTAVITSCGSAVEKLSDIQKNLAATIVKAGSVSEEQNESEGLGM